MPILFRGFRYVAADEAPKQRHMVIMVGGPASGKGFFLGEPEKISQKDVDKGKAKPADIGRQKPGTGYGVNLPKSTEGLFSEPEIPKERVKRAESDSHLRGIQYAESLQHYKTLAAAHKEGKEAFQKALDDHWYETKDGKKISLGDFVSFDKFPKSHREFYQGKTLSSFYRVMRGWHDDARRINPQTGKLAERFKDAARESFEADLRETLAGGDDRNMVIVDSAGEDIDVQDFEGQIRRGKAAGYTVSVVFLDIDKRDTELSNMSRGFVQKKRMVDGQDIDNFFKTYEPAVEKIKKANPDQFLHFKRRPPLTDTEREAVKKLMTHTPDGRPTALIDPKSPFRSIDDVEAEFPGRGGKYIVDTVQKMLYKPKYTIDSDESWLAGGKKPRPIVVTPPAVEKTKAPEEKGKADLTPDQYHEQHGRCPLGYHWDGKNCRKIEEAEYRMADALAELMGSVVKEVTKELRHVKVRGYKLDVQSGKGPTMFVRLVGAEGDITAMRILRPDLERACRKAMKPHGADFNLTASNVKGDVVFRCDVEFP